VAAVFVVFAVSQDESEGGELMPVGANLRFELETLTEWRT
jgi:hypothetical protein